MSTVTLRLIAKITGKEAKRKVTESCCGVPFPKVIHSAKEYERVTNELLLLEGRENLGPERRRLAALLTPLIDE